MLGKIYELFCIVSAKAQVMYVAPPPKRPAVILYVAPIPNPDPLAKLKLIIWITNLVLIVLMPVLGIIWMLRKKKSRLFWILFVIFLITGIFAFQLVKDNIY